MSPEQIVAGLKRSPAQIGFLCGVMWRADDPSNPRSEPVIACDTTYTPSVQRALVRKGLAVRELGTEQTAWFYLTPLDLAVRAIIQASEGGRAMTKLAEPVEVDGDALAFTQRALAEEKLAALYAICAILSAANGMTGWAWLFGLKAGLDTFAALVFWTKKSAAALRARKD